jgi:hypothetical protein
MLLIFKWKIEISLSKGPGFSEIAFPNNINIEENAILC